MKSQCRSFGQIVNVRESWKLFHGSFAKRKNFIPGFSFESSWNCPCLFIARAIATSAKDLIRFIGRIKEGKRGMETNKGGRGKRRRANGRTRLLRDIGRRLLSVIKQGTRKELDSDGSLFYTRVANTHRSGLSRRTAD